MCTIVGQTCMYMYMYMYMQLSIICHIHAHACLWHVLLMACIHVRMYMHVHVAYSQHHVYMCRCVDTICSICLYNLCMSSTQCSVRGYRSSWCLYRMASVLSSIDACVSVTVSLLLLLCFRIRGQVVHMLVDTSHPLSRGTLLHDVFESQQEKPDQKTLQRLIIRSILTIIML